MIAGIPAGTISGTANDPGLGTVQFSSIAIKDLSTHKWYDNADFNPKRQCQLAACQTTLHTGQPGKLDL